MRKMAAVVLLVICLVVHVCKGQITLIVQPNVTSNVTVCPNLMVEFTCNASEVGVLMWRVNGTEIETFTSSSGINSTQMDGPFTARLISNQQIQGSAARNYLSTLTVQSVSQLDVGSVIECLDAPDSLQSINVNYTAIGIPRILSLAVNVTPSQDGSASIILTFDATENVDMYSIAVSQGIDCPQSCTPSVSCMCTGLTPGENVMVNLNVSAVNCDTQIGSVYEVSLTPRVPDEPSSCWVVPVYNAMMMGPLVGVLAMWNNVPNPPNLANTQSQNVLDYSVTVGGQTVQVPLGTACPMNRTCSTDLGSYYDQNSNASFEVGVAATNLLGNGSTQTCEVSSIEPFNTIFDVSVLEDNRRVQCTPGEQGLSMGLSCEFCYGRDSCNNPSLTCINITMTESLSDIEEEGNYCYRATAFVNGVPVAVIQGNFTYQESISEDLEGLFRACVFFIVASFGLLIIAGVIYGLRLYLKGKNSKICDTWEKRWCVALSSLVAVTLLTLILSIILIAVSRDISNGESASLTAAALFFSLLAFIMSILVLVLVIVLVLESKKRKEENLKSTPTQSAVNPKTDDQTFDSEIQKDNGESQAKSDNIIDVASYDEHELTVQK